MTDIQSAARARDAERTKNMITTAFDATGVVLLAVAAAGCLWPYLAWAALAVAGLVLLGASLLSTYQRGRRDQPEPTPAREEPPAAPGPDDAGTLHVRGF